MAMVAPVVRRAAACPSPGPSMGTVGRVVLAGLLVSGALAGCAAAPSEPLRSHIVDVTVQDSAFHQTRSVQALSVATVTDAQGRRWPAGPTFSAMATRHLHHPEPQVALVLRHDEPRPGADDLHPVYAAIQQRRQSLRQTCREVTLASPQERVSLPVQSLTVTLLTDRARMPVPPTDTAADPLEIMVAAHPPGQVVWSTRVRVSLTPDRLARLAQSPALRYAFCGWEAELQADEHDGLRAVSRWVRNEAAAQRP